MGRLEIATVVVGCAGVAFLVGIRLGSTALRRGAVVALLGGLALFLAWQLIAPDPLASPWIPRQIPFVIVGALIAASGVGRARAWGRWLALGGGWAGVLGFGVISGMVLASRPAPEV